jgi:hypothetical protein
MTCYGGPPPLLPPQRRRRDPVRALAMTRSIEELATGGDSKGVTELGELGLTAPYEISAKVAFRER